MPIMPGGELEHYLDAFRRAGLDSFGANAAGPTN
jgi:hypothetical protein